MGHRYGSMSGKEVLIQVSHFPHDPSKALDSVHITCEARVERLQVISLTTVHRLDGYFCDI